MDEKEFEKILNKAVEPIMERLAALEKITNAAPVPITEIPEFKALSETVKTLNSALPVVNALKAEQDAGRVAAQKDSFKKQLNAAHIGSPAFEKVWDEAEADPLGRDHYLGEHPEVREKGVIMGEFKGKILNADGSEFDLAAEQAKLWGY